jgi:hypothetical protein
MRLCVRHLSRELHELFAFPDLGCARLERVVVLAH